MKKTTIFGIFALMIVGLIISTGIVSAYRGDYSVKGPEFTEERHEAIEKAFETNDYDAWYSIMSENERNSRVTSIVNKENFNIFVKAHEAGENGDYETASKLRTELGLNNGIGPKDGTGFGKLNGNSQSLKQNKQLFRNRINN